MSRSLIALLSLLAVGAIASTHVTLPTDWRISAPIGAVAATGTMPQGIALSPDGSKLAVVEAGFNPPVLRVLATGDLHTVTTIALKDAFGKPVWRDDRHVVIAGAGTNAVLTVDIGRGTISAQPSGRWLTGVEQEGPNGMVFAISDTQHNVTWSLDGQTYTANVGIHPGSIVGAPGGLYVAGTGEATVSRLVFRPDHAKPDVRTIAVDEHPAALALSRDRRRLYVACADSDAVDVVDTAVDAVVERIPVGIARGRGASPNGLAVASDGTVYVSLGAENAVAEIRGGKVVARVPAGWYPTGVAVDEHTVYTIDGKGESSRANPQFDPRRKTSSGYVAAMLSGSVRAIPRAAFTADSTAEVLANIPDPVPTPANTIVRAGGPIKHVIYIIKENRTYDQVLGDVAGANGDPKLVWFGEKITPNEHAIVKRFGIFDNTFADSQVSSNGHNWTDAAFANDYLERFWPPNYGGRRDLYDFEDGADGAVPGTGYIWDNADAHGVSLRDYGEHTSDSVLGDKSMVTSTPGLKGRIDPRYRGWDLSYSDELRVNEWQREFKGYVERDDLPGLEIVWLPNDHTAGTSPTVLKPQAMVAQNDHALGRIVDTVSHSKYWESTAIFVIEDDAQNGPDHVDDQRTTFYLASAYATAGVHHAHYTQSSVVHTIELLLGLPPMNIYDSAAPPMYDAFGLTPDATPFTAIAPRIDIMQHNEQTAYGARRSEHLDFSREDAVNPAILNDILAHAARQ